MQQTLERNWWQNARMNGVLRYQWKALSSLLGWATLILLASQLISLLFPLLTGEPYPYTGVYADLSVTLVVALIESAIAAGKSTRFLLRFGTSRLGVWLGTLMGLLAGMVAMLLATLAVSMLTGGLVLALSSAMPDKFAVKSLFEDLQGGALYSRTLGTALSDLPTLILYTLEWTCIFYLLGACLRRNRGLTITIIVGVPMLLMILTLIPAVRHAANVIQSENDTQIMLLGLQWMKYLSDFMRFVRQQWPVI
ncbi:MAG: hypothetical protein GX418_16095, partial [Clostridiales bacterium]|nr:hypothetical protein [Clostridiales bacterium]